MVFRIKANAPRLVKSAPLAALLCALMAHSAGPLSARADEQVPAAQAPADPNAGASPAPTSEQDMAPAGNTAGPDTLPDIEARTFGVKVVKRSSSGKTYLFDDITGAKTKPGKILLLKREDEPIMAFRVVKTYEDKKQFAAKRVRRYAGHRVLDADDQFMAVEKVGDLAPPPQTPQDKADLKELEAGQTPSTPPVPTAPPPDVQAYDPDLDAGSSPPPSGAVDSESARDKYKDDDDDDDDSHLGMVVDEVLPLDPNTQWISGGFGFIHNKAADGSDVFPGAAGIRYGLSLGRMIFLRRARIQDSIVAEAGMFFYKLHSFFQVNDAYTVTPLIGTIRYNILFGESFTLFLYGGMMKNYVSNVAQGDDATTAALGQSLPAGGGGILFRVGPSWDMRVDLGYDIVGLGLVLRF